MTRFHSHPSRRVPFLLNLSLLPIAFCFFQSCDYNQKGPIIVEATLVREIRDWNDSIFFGTLTDIEYSNDKYFLTDGSANQVIVLNDQLDYVGRFGNSGDGPAEIRGIMNIETSGDDIYVQDILGAKILKYDSNFQLTDTFKVHLSPSELVVTNDNIIGQLYGEVENPFSVINTVSKEQNRFGNKLEPELGFPFKHILKHKDLLLVFHQLNSANVEVYNSDGEFLSSTNLSQLNDDFAKWLESTNIEQKVRSSTPRIRNAQYVFFDVVQQNDKFYLNPPPMAINGKQDGIILEVSMNDQLEFNLDRIIHLNEYISLGCFTMPKGNMIIGFDPVNGSIKLFEF